MKDIPGKYIIELPDAGLLVPWWDQSVTRIVRAQLTAAIENFHSSTVPQEHVRGVEVLVFDDEIRGTEEAEFLKLHVVNESYEHEYGDEQIQRLPSEVQIANKVSGFSYLDNRGQVSAIDESFRSFMLYMHMNKMGIPEMRLVHLAFTMRELMLRGDGYAFNEQDNQLARALYDMDLGAVGAAEKSRIYLTQEVGTCAPGIILSAWQMYRAEVALLWLRQTSSDQWKIPVIVGRRLADVRWVYEKWLKQRG